jgi:hypothetical protein
VKLGILGQVDKDQTYGRLYAYQAYLELFTGDD